MKKPATLLLFFWLSAGMLFAQKSKITIGALAENQGDYEKAINTLEAALHPDNIHLIANQKDIAKGQYHLFRAYLAVGLNKNYDAIYPDALLRASVNLLNALSSTDPYAADRWKKQAASENATTVLHHGLYNKSILFFNNQDYKESLRRLKAGNEIKAEDFMTHRMLGANYLLLKDTLTSIAHFRQAIDIYQDRYILSPEAASNKEHSNYSSEYEQLPFVFLQLAFLLVQKHSPDQALEVILQGKAILPDDRDIALYELAIYQTHPRFFLHGIEAFKEAIAENPDDLALHNAFATLLFQAGRKEEAIQNYLAICQKAPKDYTANFGIVSYYVNMAADFDKESLEVTTESELVDLEDKIKACLAIAYPHLIILHDLEPEKEIWLTQLVGAASRLGPEKEKELDVWLTKLSELR